jgi:hypothetical protein
MIKLKSLVSNLLISWLILNSLTLQGQHIGYFPSFAAEKTFTEVPFPGVEFRGKDDFRRRHEYFLMIPVGNKTSIIGTHSTFSGWTQFSIDEVETGFAGHGSSRIRVRRTGVSVSRRLADFRNLIKVSAFVTLNYESSLNSSRKKEREFQVVNREMPEDISDLTNWTVSVEALPSTQVVPGFGFRADIRLFWRVYGHLHYGWTFGNRRYQNLFFEHDYQGEPAPTAVFFSNGTIRYKGWGVSLKFWGDKDEFEKGKMEWF